jgi:hypothetical protein
VLLLISKAIHALAMEGKFPKSNYLARELNPMLKRHRPSLDMFYQTILMNEEMEVASSKFTIPRVVGSACLKRLYTNTMHTPSEFFNVANDPALEEEFLAGPTSLESFS